MEPRPDLPAAPAAATAEPATPEAPRAAGRRAGHGRPLALAGLLLLVVLGLYGRVLWHPFVAYDDHVSIAYNPDYTPPRPGNLWHYWADWRTGYLHFYAPVLYTTWGLTAWATGAYAPDAGLPWGMRAGPFHALSLIAHAGATLATFALLRRLLGRDDPPADRDQPSRRSGPWGRDAAAFVGAALFAVHPLQVESVAWASTLYTPLSGALALAALWQFRRFTDGLADQDGGSDDARRGGPAAAAWRRPWVAYVVATALFALALLTKPSVVAVPALAWVFEATIRARRSGGGVDADRRHRRPLVVAAVALLPWLAMAGAMTYITSQLTHAEPEGYHPPAWQRPLVAADALGFYLVKLFWPADLGPDYGRTPERVLTAGLPVAWASLAVLVAITAAAAVAARRAPRMAAAWAAFVAGAAVALGLVPFEFQVYSTTADRYAYLALLGPALAAAAAVAWLSAPRRHSAAGTADAGTPAETSDAEPPRVRPVPLYAAVGVLLAGLTAASAGQLSLWADGPTLFAHAIAVNPDSPIGHQSTALELQALGRVPESIAYVRRTTELRPNDPRTWSLLGLSLMRAGRPAEAVGAYRRAIDVFVARDITPTRSDPWASLGIALLAAGRGAEAEAALLDAARRRPDSLDAHRGLAELYRRRRRPDLALPALEAIARLRPDDPAAQRAARQLRWQLMEVPSASAPSTAPSAWPREDSSGGGANSRPAP